MLNKSLFFGIGKFVKKICRKRIRQQCKNDLLFTIMAIIDDEDGRWKNEPKSWN